MPLNWDITRVQNWEALDSEDERTITEAIAFSTLTVGLGRITSENVKEWDFRLRVLAKLGESKLFAHLTDGRRLTTDSRRYDHHPRRIARADIHRRRGLTTNVAELSRKAWMTMIVLPLFEREVTTDVVRDRVNARHPRPVTA